MCPPHTHTYTDTQNEKHRQDGQREREKKSAKAKELHKLHKLVLRLFYYANLSSKVHLTRAGVSPSASNTKAEGTHRKCMDIVKKKKIYKGAETPVAQRQSGRLRKPLSPRLFSEDGSKKKMPL